MSKPIRVLIVEDSEDDAFLLLREIRRGGYEPNFLRVDTLETMKSALSDDNWDIVLIDHVMPQFSGPAAWALLEEEGLDLPPLRVAGVIGEEAAVDAMRAGARDYNLTNRRKRGGPAIDRERGRVRGGTGRWAWGLRPRARRGPWCGGRVVTANRSLPSAVESGLISNTNESNSDACWPRATSRRNIGSASLPHTSPAWMCPWT